MELLWEVFSMKIRLHVSTRYVGSDVEEVIDVTENWGIDLEEWTQMSENEKKELCLDWLLVNIDWSWGEMDG